MRAVVWMFACMVNVTQAAVSINNKQLSMHNGLYNISQNLGQTVGNNLFHSFDRFHLAQGEVAQFSGSNSVQNIVSRIIGGESSFINGTIRSTIPNANFYFLNPYGIVFGAYAQLDLQGSFHASTADYIQLSDGGEFHASFPKQDILTTAPVESFGFLNDSPSDIHLQNSHLTVPNEACLSLIGGDLHLSGQSEVVFDENYYQALSAGTALIAGHIYLASAASQGTVTFNQSNFSLNAEGGEIHLEKILVDTSGKGAGSVFIRGGQLLMSDASIQNNTLAEQDGLNIDINLFESIDMRSSMAQQVLIAKTVGRGKGAEVNITTPVFNLSNAIINLSSLSSGDAGSLSINASQAIFDTAQIRSGAFGQGKSSNYNINVDKSITLSGQSHKVINNDGIKQPKPPSQISTNSYAEGEIGSITINTGHLSLAGGVIAVSSFSKQTSGNMTIQANSLDVSEGGVLASSALGGGDAGNMMITVKETLSVRGKRNGVYITHGGEFKDNESSISNFSYQGNGGNTTILASTVQLEGGSIGSASFGVGKKTGIINITADYLEMSQGGWMSNSNRGLKSQGFLTGTSEGSLINIDAKTIKIAGADSGIFSETHSSGRGGNIKIQAKDIMLQDQGAISAFSASTGEAGQIQISTDNIYIHSQGKISTDAKNAFGGDIDIKSTHLTFLQQGNIVTSVHNGCGNGGNISISNPKFLVLNQSKIIAQADAGQGGNIKIVADQFLKSPDSLVSASSRLGIDGNIQIDSPTENMSSGLLALDNHFIKQIKINDMCKEAIAGQLPTEFQFPLTFKANMHRYLNDFIDNWIPSAAPDLKLSSCKY